MQIYNIYFNIFNSFIIVILDSVRFFFAKY